MLNFKNYRKVLKATLFLPFSKSISNRLIILHALSNGKVKYKNLSTADDTNILKKLIKSKKTILNARNAGTTFRFLTAYLAFGGKRKILTGSDRMCQRPVGILVDALKTLGATINYLGKKGFPPLEFLPAKPLNNYPSLEISAGTSSQFISALMMIAPRLPHGLLLILKGEINSYSYIKMTMGLLNQSGIKVYQTKNRFQISPQSFNSVTIKCERDWSSAGYWYSLAAINGKADFYLKELMQKSLQGDAVIPVLFKKLGVDSFFTKKGLRIVSGQRKNFKNPKQIEFDFTDCPDLAQTVIACCAALGINGKFLGLESLRIKETDRLRAMRKELKKFNCRITKKKRFWLLNSSKRKFPEKCIIETYGDHRMAMSFAPFAVKMKKLVISHPEVVKKSYPGFWKEFKLFVHS